MNRIMAFMLGSMLLMNFGVQAEPNAADQKWLEGVEKIVAKGETSIPTSSEQRAALLKDWATKKGYAVLVGRSEGSYHVELFPKIAER